MSLLDTLVLVFIIVVAILAGTNSKANTRRKLDRMINEEYDRRYKNKK